MKTVQEIITARGGIAAVHQSYISLENPPFMRLVVEVLNGPFPNGAYELSVAHYTTQNGDAMRDPEIVWHVVPAENPKDWQWRPLVVQMDFLGYYREVAQTAPDGTWHCLRPVGARDLVSFGRKWNRNLREQGFLTAARAEAMPA